ncbi:leucine-rich repeat domain-containing protein [Leptospira santarosai]|uniref:leucine-rich repeat domain-containing protein n=1 Tax=Leptospira santarosai TaxID=28183 RepID=UPI000A7BD3A3|nr:leucine-rich repeat domain-containing protein [Leptospira santarosai]
MQNLKILSLGSNQLATLPKEVGKLQNLQELYLYNNRLTTLPKEIGKLQNLKELNLGGNPFLRSQKEKIQKLLPNVIIQF